MFRPLVYLGAIITAAIGVTSLLGYVWNAQELTTDQWLPPVAINTGLAFTLLSFGNALMSGAIPARSAAERSSERGAAESKVWYGLAGTLALLCLGGGITYRMQANFVAAAQRVAGAREARALLDARLARARSYTLLALLTTLSVATVALLVLFGSIVRDIRERARIGIKLREAQQEAQRATLAKSEFLAAMSHEIRTPMNGVIGMLELLQQSSLVGQQLEMVKLTRESADALLTIIDDILDFSKIEAGRLEIERAPMSVADAVEKSCALLNRLAERKRTILTAFCDPAIPAQLMGDGTRLRQVLINLVNNAIKFSSDLEHPGRVSVRAQLAERRDDVVIVEFVVMDNGIGMDEATQRRLFSSFMQADASTTRRYGGTGLGLAISKQLISLMGGTVSVDSGIRLGSKFRVRLPFAPVPQAAQPVEWAVDLKGLSCLVVGGSQGLADDLATYLQADGAGVRRAADEGAMSEWAREQPPGVAVCVLEAAGPLPSIADLRARLRTRADLSVRIVIVVLGRAVRNPRAEGEGIVVLDGNALGRKTLIDAVAIAAGRTPSRIEQELVPQRMPRSPPPTRADAIRLGRLILVAEDNDINQKVITEQLALLGYTADVVANGREALERWHTGQYALVLADLHMPEMDGYALTLQIRSEESGSSHIPIIALTANALAGEAERCRSVGMDDYLSKPAPIDALARVMSRWLSVSKPQPPQFETTARVPRAVDVRILESLIGNDPTLVREFLRDFAASAARLAAALVDSHTRGNSIETAAIAHKLKSSARSVGALKLGELCAAIEEAVRSRNGTIPSRLITAFGTEMAAVQEHLETQHLNTAVGAAADAANCA
jgi:two-component system, sensor histidine kinase and response regulator